MRIASLTSIPPKIMSLMRTRKLEDRTFRGGRCARRSPQLQAQIPVRRILKPKGQLQCERKPKVALAAQGARDLLEVKLRWACLPGVSPRGLRRGFSPIRGLSFSAILKPSTRRRVSSLAWATLKALWPTSLEPFGRLALESSRHQPPSASGFLLVNPLGMLQRGSIVRC